MSRTAMQAMIKQEGIAQLAKHNVSMSLADYLSSHIEPQMHTLLTHDLANNTHDSEHNRVLELLTCILRRPPGHHSLFHCLAHDASTA